VFETLGINGRDYALMTMHRPSNVDDEAPLSDVVDMIRRLSDRTHLPHPQNDRTYKDPKPVLAHENLPL